MQSNLLALLAGLDGATLLRLMIAAALTAGLLAYLAAALSFGSRRSRLEAERAALDEKLAYQTAALQESQDQLVSRQEENEALHQECRSLTREKAEFSTLLDERDRAHRQQLAQFEEQKQALAREFENLANRIFEEKGQRFTETSQTHLDALLKPFREQIDGFQKRVNEIHDQSLRGHTQLGEEIRRVLEIGLKMSDEASSLATALKGDSQQRGAWGEAQLERTLQMSGLVETDHYEAQTAFKDENGRRRQTDYLVKLPDGKHLIIDSKVSLVDYDRAAAAETDEERAVALREHVRAVRRHIEELSAKDYTNLVGMRSPSFVLMFMPIEAAYIDALRSNRDLFNHGYEKGIVLVSHTTLIPILRTVANLWMIERGNAEAREISDRAGEIFNQVCLLAERLRKLGGTLSTASNHYNDTVTALAGQQGLYGKVERFATLSSKVSKQLPEMEAAHIDFEEERLSLVAVPEEAPESVTENERSEPSPDVSPEANEMLTSPG